MPLAIESLELIDIWLPRGVDTGCVSGCFPSLRIWSSKPTKYRIFQSNHFKRTHSELTKHFIWKCWLNLNKNYIIYKAKCIVKIKYMANKGYYLRNKSMKYETLKIDVKLLWFYWPITSITYISVYHINRFLG